MYYNHYVFYCVYLMGISLNPLNVTDKCGNLSDSNNYRPIVVATITSKVLVSNKNKRRIRILLFRKRNAI